MSSDPSSLRLEVILGSIRPSRFGTVVLNWYVEQAQQDPTYDVGVVDLADFDIRGDFAQNADVAALTDRITAADAVVVVTPEYNHSFPGPLKSAIDTLPKSAWEAKPVAFVSYGGLSGGLRAVEALRIVFCEIHATTIRDTVSFHGTSASFDEHGHPVHAELVNGAARQQLGQLAWWAFTLRDGKAARPYGSLVPTSR